MRHRDEVQSVPAVITDRDEGLVGVGLHDRSRGSRGPATRIGKELDDIEDRVSWVSDGLRDSRIDL